jgi:hypothetical protein
MPADPVAAGRKGGLSRSEAKRAASKRNGFQKASNKPAPESDAPTATISDSPTDVEKQ